MGLVLSCFETGHVFWLFADAEEGKVVAVQDAIRSQPSLLLCHNALEGDTVLHIAAQYGHLELAKGIFQLVEQDADRLLAALSPKERKKLNVHNCPQDASAVTTFTTALVSSTNDKGRTPLHVACLYNKPEMVTFLLSQGADPWTLDRCGGRAPLHYCALHNSVEAMESLVSSIPESNMQRRVPRGAGTVQVEYLNVPSQCGFTALHYAAGACHPEAADWLLSNGASINSTSTIGYGYDIIGLPAAATPLHVAGAVGSMDVALVILRHYYARQNNGEADPRRRLDRAFHNPAWYAHNCHWPLLAQLLHPRMPLEGLFHDVPVVRIGVPRLAVLAADACRGVLAKAVEQTERHIQKYCDSTGQNYLPPDGEATNISLEERKHLEEESQQLRRISTLQHRAGSLSHGSSVMIPHAAELIPHLVREAAALPGQPEEEPAPPSQEASRVQQGSSQGALPHADSTASGSSHQTSERPIQIATTHCKSPGTCKEHHNFCRSSSDPEQLYTLQPWHKVPGLYVRDSAYIHHETEPVAQCVVCWDDLVACVVEPCKHRLCTTCAHDLLKTFVDKPLLCPTCRLPIVTFNAPI